MFLGCARDKIAYLTGNIYFQSKIAKNMKVEAAIHNTFICMKQ